MRGLSAVLLSCGALMGMSAPGMFSAYKASAPPRSEVLIAGLSSSLELTIASPIKLSLIRLTSSPPTEFAARGELQCSGSPWTLESPTGEVLTLSSDTKDRALWLLMVWLCEPYPIKTLNESSARLDPDERAILVDDAGFSYRLGAQERSHMIVSFELDHVESISFKPSKKGFAHHLVASRRVSAGGEAVTLSLSEDGKLRWTAKIERVVKK